MTSGLTIVSKKLQCPEYKEKYKTELCRNWINGFCSFNDKCVFAHGAEELKVKAYSGLTWKTEKQKSTKVAKKKSTKIRLPVFVELSKRLEAD